MVLPITSSRPASIATVPSLNSAVPPLPVPEPSVSPALHRQLSADRDAQRIGLIGVTQRINAVDDDLVVVVDD